MDIIIGLMIALAVFIFVLTFLVNDPHGAAIVLIIPAGLVFIILAVVLAVLEYNKEPDPPTSETQVEATVEQKIQRIDVLKSIPQRNINGTNRDSE